MSNEILEVPPFAKYAGQDSFFGGTPPLSKAVGYLVVLGKSILQEKTRKICQRESRTLTLFVDRLKGLGLFSL